MTKEEIREKYQRDDPSDSRGLNKGAVDIFINMVERMQVSEDSNIRNIANNIGIIGHVAPNFVIFQAPSGGNSFFMHNFKAFQIALDCGYDTASHEFGHAVLSMATDTKVPENFEQTILKAQEHALKPENKEFFKSYIEYLAKGGNERTDLEIGPVSDIISSVFQREGHRIGSYENVCWLPSFHSREYYYDEENNAMRLDKIFDEDFANIFAIKAGGGTQELETLRRLFGDDFVQTIENEIDAVSNFFEKQSEKESESNQMDTIDSIKSVIVGVKKEDIDKVKTPEKESRQNIMEDSEEQK